MYSSVFENQHGSQLSIERDGNHLRIVAPNGSWQLVPMGNDHFEMLGLRQSFDFIVEDDNVTQVELRVFRVTYIYVKEGVYESVNMSALCCKRPN